MSNSNSDLTISANALTFNFSAQALRVVMRDGEPWFVAADVCAALGIQRTSDAVEKLDGDEKGTDLIHPITHKFFLFLKQRVRQKFRDGKRLPSSFCTCQKYVKTAQSA